MSYYKKQNFQDHDNKTWGFVEKIDQESNEETSSISNGSSSSSSCSSFDTIDDDASSSSSSSIHSNESSLLDLSDLMSQLPIKRGLSKFYHGKSESFTSLASVKSVEDLPKKNKNSYNKAMKMKFSIKSYKSYTLPKPMISKKVSPFLRQRSFARSTMNPSQQINN